MPGASYAQSRVLTTCVGNPRKADGSADDPLDWQPHIKNKPRREALANRFKIAKDQFKLVIPQKNLAVELLRKLLNDEIKTRTKKNLVQARSFAEMLEKALRAYQNRAVETAQIIEQLIQLAKEMREAQQRGQDLGLSDDELAFYDALETNDSAVMVLRDKSLRLIAQELVQTVKQNVIIDWTVKETVRAKLRVMVRRILRKYGYPPTSRRRPPRPSSLRLHDLSASHRPRHPPRSRPTVHTSRTHPERRSAGPVPSRREDNSPFAPGRPLGPLVSDRHHQRDGLAMVASR